MRLWDAKPGPARAFRPASISLASRLPRISVGSVALSAVLVPALLGLAVALRVVDLDRVGFNSDEAVYSGQAGALIGDETMSHFFSVFRAHPLLLQTLLGGLFELVGVSDLAARLFVALAFGVGSVVLTYMLAYRLYGQRVAIVAAAILAVLPYHVIVSRQVLLDPPLGFFVILSLWFVARGTDDHSGRWMIAAALAAALATATKEVAVLLFAVVASFTIISGLWRRFPSGRFRRLAVSLVLFGGVVAPFPLTRVFLAPGSGSSYLLWQFTRPANHHEIYFLEILGQFGGLAFVGLAFLGIVVMLNRLRLRAEGDLLILLWLIVFFGFFQMWRIKLFSYLMVLVPALAICAAVGLDAAARWLASAVPRFRVRNAAWAGTLVAVATLVLVVQMGSASVDAIRGGAGRVASPVEFDIEVQDFAGGREFGEWARDRTPPGARFLSIGPSIGNILRFYGDRDSVALSVSSDLRKRNPAYVPVPNPDLWLRQMGIHYIVWDFYSADRSAFYNARLMTYVRKYGVAAVFAVYQNADGSLFFGTDPPKGAEPRIIVYDTVGGDPLGTNTNAAGTEKK